MKSIKIIGIILFSIVLNSCSDSFLDKTKLGALSTEKFFLTEIDADQAVIAAYSDLKDYRYTWTIWAFGDVLSDDATYSGSAADAQAYATMESFNYPVDNGRVLQRYQMLFRGVNKANQAIEGIKKMDEAIFKTISKNKLLGEALFLRAYYYHELVIAYGAVPLMTSTPTIADKTLTRTPVADVYAQIEKDLINAASYLPKKENQNLVKDAGRITKGAANAMLSRVYLFEKKYELCKATSKEVFKESYALVPNYADIFTLAGEHGSESILEIDHYNSSSQSGATTNNGNFHVLMMLPGGVTYGYGINQPSVNLAAAFDAEGDVVRKDATLLTMADLILWEGATNAAKVTNVRSGYWNQKFYLKPAQRSVEIRNNPVNNRLIRLSEVYLNYAEACAKTPTATDGENEARTYLNLVRARVNLLPKISTGNALFEDVFNERRLELAMEGHRFFDLVRTGKAATVLASKGNFRAGISDLLPIPQAEIDNSGGVITQNPL